MVHPQARAPIVATSIGEVPIGIDALVGVKVPYGIHPTVLKHHGIGLPTFRKIDGIAYPSLRYDRVD